MTPPLGHFLDGGLVPTSEAGIQVRRPSDTAIYAHVPDGGAEPVGNLSPRDRARILAEASRPRCAHR